MAPTNRAVFRYAAAAAVFLLVLAAFASPASLFLSAAAESYVPAFAQSALGRLGPGTTSGSSSSSSAVVDAACGSSQDAWASCDACPADDELCRAIGEHNLARSVVTRGSGLRLRRFLRKLAAGQPVTVVVLGGSVSAGHGVSDLGPDGQQLDEKPVFGRVLFDQLTQKYPHPDHVFHSGAKPSRGSAYFATCLSNHLPPNPDLIFTEHNLNDPRALEAQNTYDSLLRALLVLPSKPAIVNVHVVAVESPTKAMLMGGETALAVAAFYDVPTISTAMVLLPKLIRNPELTTDFFDPYVKGEVTRPYDGRHMNAKGHRLTAELLRIFLERELCKLARASERAAEEEDDDDQAQLPWLVLPAKGDFDVASRLGITSQFNLSLAAIDKASIWHCLATGAGGHPLVPSAATGWAEWTDPTNQKVFLRATKPGASFSFETSALADGTIVLGFLSSAFLPFGDLRCSLKRADDAAGEPLKVKDVVLRGAHKQDLPLPITVTHTQRIFEDVGPGAYALSCTLQRPAKLAGDFDFRILSLATA